jgi:plasmid maintenance system antidote protein VapI
MDPTRPLSIRYVPDRMRSVGEIVRVRLAAIGLLQKGLAELVEVDPTNLSRILDGERRLAVEDAPRWCEALRLSGDECDEFILAVHLSLSTELVRSVVDRLTIDKADALAVIAFYEDKARLMRRMLDAMDRVRDDRQRR